MWRLIAKIEESAGSGRLVAQLGQSGAWSDRELMSDAFSQVARSKDRGVGDAITKAVLLSRMKRAGWGAADKVKWEDGVVVVRREHKGRSVLEDPMRGINDEQDLREEVIEKIRRSGITKNRFGTERLGSLPAGRESAKLEGLAGRVVVEMDEPQYVGSSMFLFAAMWIEVRSGAEWV